MSLDVYLKRKKWISYDAGKTLTEENETIYDANITHNLGNYRIAMKFNFQRKWEHTE